MNVRARIVTWCAAVLACVAAISLSEERIGAASPRAVSSAEGRDHDSVPILRVRTLDRSIATVLDDGLTLSPTLRHLVDAISASDVIVYISSNQQPGNDLDGGLNFITVAGGQRYLRIVIRRGLSYLETAAVLGHELQHATEVAAASKVKSLPSMLALYRSIGFEAGWGRFETSAAQQAARLVREEILASERPRARNW